MTCTAKKCHWHLYICSFRGVRFLHCFLVKIVLILATVLKANYFLVYNWQRSYKQHVSDWLYCEEFSKLIILTLIVIQHLFFLKKKSTTRVDFFFILIKSGLCLFEREIKIVHTVYDCWFGVLWFPKKNLKYYFRSCHETFKIHASIVIHIDMLFFVTKWQSLLLDLILCVCTSSFVFILL